jgi:elongation factor P
MSVSASDLKAGVTFEKDGKMYKVFKYSISKIGRGGANVKVKVRDLSSGGMEEFTFGSTQKFDEVETRKRPLTYLYKSGGMVVFMDGENFEQVEVSEEVLGSDILYVKEGEVVDVLFAEGEAVSVELSPKVTLKVVETVPGVKGNSATNIYKPAKLENGLEVKVPLFIKVGDKIRVDTRDGSYVERVN